MIEPLTLKAESVASYMNDFRKSQTAEVLYGLWAKERERLINIAKKSRKSEDIAMLDGYDIAINLIDKWAELKPKREIPEIFAQETA